MIDTLLDIPVHVRGRLASALESGLLAPPGSAMSVRATVGGGYEEAMRLAHASGALDAARRERASSDRE